MPNIKLSLSELASFFKQAFQTEDVVIKEVRLPLKMGGEVIKGKELKQLIGE